MIPFLESIYNQIFWRWSRFSWLWWLNLNWHNSILGKSLLLWYKWCCCWSSSRIETCTCISFCKRSKSSGRNIHFGCSHRTNWSISNLIILILLSRLDSSIFRSLPTTKLVPVLVLLWYKVLILILIVSSSLVVIVIVLFVVLISYVRLIEFLVLIHTSSLVSWLRLLKVVVPLLLVVEIIKLWWRWLLHKVLLVIHVIVLSLIVLLILVVIVLLIIIHPLILVEVLVLISHCILIMRNEWLLLLRKTVEFLRYKWSRIWVESASICCHLRWSWRLC